MALDVRADLPSELPARRRELADFLRSRRARIAPEDAGLIAGRRRRTPGLRREEVAQLASVGVTWYTWLEQGRPIHASADVVDAIGRALRLDPTEREHLFRLADVAPTVADPAIGCLDPEMQVILDGLLPLPATILNSRYDILAWNSAYLRLFPKVEEVAPADRNVLWQMFVVEGCFVRNPEVERPRVVAVLRGNFSRHLGEPAWMEFVDRLSAASPEFKEIWDRHDVAENTNRLKHFRMGGGEELELYVTSLNLVGTPETRMVVYTPVDAATAAYLDIELPAH
jgi:hypothetical protein